MPDFTNPAAGAAIISIIADNSKLNASLAESKGKLEKFALAAAEIGKKMALVGNALVSPFANATRIFADFDDQMRTVTEPQTGNSVYSTKALNAHRRK